ncbi:MAG: TIGR04219 family outer membrane beta-barrel protein [Desulforegulaceae bacterium]|nr:TIGR04219 family outer membrane beta-barrel protein [Desulforegulaceae bacterium]
MKSKLAVLPLLFFLLVPFQGYCLPLIDAEIAVGGWLNSPKGFAGYKGDNLYLENDLGYDDETKLTARARIELPLILPNLTVMATNLNYEERSTMGRKFTFGGKNFEENKSFNSELKLDHYDFALSFSLPFLKLASLGTLQADLGVNLRLVDLDASITQGEIKESKSFTVPIPMGFAYLRLEPVSGIALEAEGRMISLGGNNVTSLIGRLRYNIFGPLFIAGGYRVEKFDIDEKDVRVDTKFKGPFFEGGFKF